ncbi:MAG: EVE domain-containing protein [Candidatus Pacebacteria bacterium]|nr:EVE domain-containing protein [Candidatus Paceibacterota bacterium]
MNYWLIKSEPDTYSIDELKRDKTTAWEGVRNYQARNHMRAMKKGDLVLFYHSSTEPTGIAGIAEVATNVHPDMSQFKNGNYFEPRARKDAPVWDCVDISFVSKAKEFIPLSTLKDDAKLDGMVLLQRGSRLSVQPVTKEQFAHIQALLGE